MFGINTISFKTALVMLACSLLLFVSTFPSLSSAQSSPWLLTTTELPSDYSNRKCMPTLGNGKLAVNPYLQLDPEVPPSITANCLYSGDSWNSHRARFSILDISTVFKRKSLFRIPNYSNYKLSLSNSDMRGDYTLDLKRAQFLANFESDDFLVSHQVLVHRVYTRTIVNVVTGSAKQDSDSSLTVDIALEVGPVSDDITNTEVTEIEIFNNTLGIEKIWYRCETTQEVEFSQYQPSPTQVCFAWMEPWDSSLYLNGQNPEQIRGSF